MLSKYLFVIQKLRLIGSSFVNIAQNTLHDFQSIGFVVALSSTNATKMFHEPHYSEEKKKNDKKKKKIERMNEEKKKLYIYLMFFVIINVSLL